MDRFIGSEEAFLETLVNHPDITAHGSAELVLDLLIIRIRNVKKEVSNIPKRIMKEAISSEASFLYTPIDETDDSLRSLVFYRLDNLYLTEYPEGLTVEMAEEESAMMHKAVSQLYKEHKLDIGLKELLKVTQDLFDRREER